MVSASRVAEKLVCVAAKPTAPWGREDGGRGVKGEEQGNGDPPLGQSPDEMPWGLRPWPWGCRLLHMGFWL